jgi:rubredoxin
MAYVCRVCDYIYIPENKRNERDEKKAFLKLPKEWSCPECGAKKGSFIWIDYVQTPQRR